MIKQLFIFCGFFLSTILLNALFQTACQSWLSIQIDGDTRCRLTTPLNGAAYLILILMLSIGLYLGFTTWHQRKKNEKQQKQEPRS